MMIATMPEVDPKGLYSITETARLLGQHRNTISRYLRNGQLVAWVPRYGGRIRIKGSDIMKIWREGPKPPIKAPAMAIA